MRAWLFIGGLGVLSGAAFVFSLWPRAEEPSSASRAGLGATLSVLDPSARLEGSVLWRPARPATGEVSVRVLSLPGGEPASGASLLLDDGGAVPVDETGEIRIARIPVSILAVRGERYANPFDEGRHRLDVLEPVSGIQLHVRPAAELSTAEDDRTPRRGRVRSSSPLPITVELEALAGPDEPVSSAQVLPGGPFALSAPDDAALRALAIQGNAVAVAKFREDMTLLLPSAGPFRVGVDGSSSLGPTHVSLEWIGSNTRRVLEERLIYGRIDHVAFDHVGEGRFRVELRRTDGFSAAGELDLVRPPHPELRLEWTPGATLTGLVRDSRNKPISGARVQLLQRRGFAFAPPELETLSSGQGAFALTGIPAGRHTFMVTAPGFEPRLGGERQSEGRGELRPLMIRLNSARRSTASRNEGAGIGVVFKPRVYELLVAAVEVSGGAQEAGLRPGDRVVAVQGQPVSEIGYQRALHRLRGPDGTAVEVEVRPVGSRGTSVVRVERRAGFGQTLR